MRRFGRTVGPGGTCHVNDWKQHRIATLFGEARLKQWADDTPASRPRLTPVAPRFRDSCARAAVVVRLVVSVGDCTVGRA
jgi:hypothetical protein